MTTLAEPLLHAAVTMPGGLAMIDGDRRFTFAETLERCRRLAGALNELGLERGERVAFFGPNSIAYLEAHMAVPAGGWAIVPLNTRHAEPELRYALTDSGAQVLITDRDPGSLADCVRHVIRLPIDDLLERATPAELGEGVGEDDLAALYYTGGTTGASKGVMLSHRNLVANAWHMIAASEMNPGDVWLALSPLFHVAGTFALFSTVWRGGAHVPLPAFDPGGALDLIASEGVTATLGVPTMLAAMTEEQRARPRDVSSLRSLGHAGAPIATETIRRACETFPDAEIVQYYGATETAPFATVHRHEERDVDSERVRSCGRPGIGLRVRVLDPLGAELPPRQVGEVAIRGPNVMQGYWHRPDETAAVLIDGWYRSGDLGYLDEGAYLYLVDRAKDMIVTGGENVYSVEVEEVLYAHPKVAEAAVFGVPDERWGEAVHAIVVAREEVSADELLSFCRQRLAGYKLPKRVDFSSAPLPKSGPGKILKRELREPYWAGRKTRIGN